MKYTIYDPATGEIQSILDVSTEIDKEKNLGNATFLLGEYDNRFYIENGSPIEKLPDPSNNILKYNFDYSNKNWILDLTRSIDNARRYRNLLLADIDRINPMWYNSMTYDQQQQLIDYRSALLNVPQQPGFPTQIEWPQKPSWL